MRHHTWTFAVPLGTCLVLGPAAAPALAQCPTNTINVCGVVTSNTPSYSASGCGPVSLGTGSYDLPAGILSAHGEADYPDGFAVAHVTTDDIYQIAGPPTLVSLSFMANLHAHGQGSSYYCTAASGSASLQSGALSQSVSFHGSNCYGGEGIDQIVSLPLQHSVGDTFHLVLDVVATASAGANSSMDGTLTFSGLPQGYTIVSCQGFNSGPTPNQMATWGRLKLRYR